MHTNIRIEKVRLVITIGAHTIDIFKSPMHANSMMRSPLGDLERDRLVRNFSAEQHKSAGERKTV